MHTTKQRKTEPRGSQGRAGYRHQGGKKKFQCWLLSCFCTRSGAMTKQVGDRQAVHTSQNNWFSDSSHPTTRNLIPAKVKGRATSFVSLGCFKSYALIRGELLCNNVRGASLPDARLICEKPEQTRNKGLGLQYDDTHPPSPFPTSAGGLPHPIESRTCEDELKAQQLETFHTITVASSRSCWSCASSDFLPHSL